MKREIKWQISLMISFREKRFTMLRSIKLWKKVKVLIIKMIEEKKKKRMIFKLLRRKKSDKFIKYRVCKKSPIKLSITGNIEILILSISHQPVHKK